MNTIFNDLFTTTNFFCLLIAVIPSTITYIATKYNIQKPIKLQTKKVQFEKVYLPLYKLTYDKSSKTPINELIELVKKMDWIMSNHFEFVFPEIHQLTNDLRLALNTPYEKVNNMDYKTLVNQLFYQIEYDYKSLKRQLGYPCKGTAQSFLRMPKSKKIIYCCIWIYNIFGTILTFAFLFLVLFSPEDMTMYIIVIFISFIPVIFIMNYLYRQNKLF